MWPQHCSVLAGVEKRCKERWFWRRGLPGAAGTTGFQFQEVGIVKNCICLQLLLVSPAELEALLLVTVIAVLKTRRF